MYTNTLRKMPEKRKKSWSSNQLPGVHLNTRTARRFSPSQRASVSRKSAGLKLSSL